MRRVRSVAAALVVLLGLGLTSCTSGVNGSPVADPAATRWSVASALAQLPLSGLEGHDASSVIVGDMARAAELAGVVRPVQGADGESFVSWAFEIRGMSSARVAVVLPEVVAPTFVVKAPEFLDEVGWNIGTVNSFAEISATTDTFSVLTGAFTASTLTAAMGNPVDGVWRIGPDSDGDVDVAGRSAARPLGQSMRTGLSGDSVAVS